MGAAFHQALSCDNNPRVAHAAEADYWPVPAAVKKRVVIVGAGVAGMEAAWTAAARGHAVTVFSQSRDVGGKARLRAQLPGGEATSSIYDYQQAAAQRAGVTFELGITATVADVLALKPDHVILATGADMVAPRWLPPAAREVVTDLRTAMQNLLHVKTRQPGTAVLYDMDLSEGTYASAERLQQIFAHVVIVTPYVMRLVVAAATGFDRSCEQAALSLGASHFTVFRRITLPMILPGVAGGWLLAFINSFDEVTMSIFVTAPSTVTLPVRMYMYATESIDPLMAAASALMVGFTAAVMVLLDRLYGLDRILVGGK